MAMRFPPTAHGSDFPPPQDAPGARTSESPIDHALTLLLAGEIDAAMRWAAATLERAPSPSGLLVTCRLLDQMGRTRAAIEGLKLAVQQSVDRGDLPLAVAAIDDLRVLGADVGEHIDRVATAFCRGSSRLHRGEVPPMLPPSAANDFVQPLSPFLAGPALASKATQIVQATRHRYEETAGGELPRVLPVPLFSALSKGALRDVLSAFHVMTVPAGHRVILEGDEGHEAYVVVRGEVEISRRAAHGDNKFTLALARLGGGAFFGEMALLSLMPSPASATATRPSILLSARREALVEIAANRPEIAGQLAAHCRRNSLANLGWTSQVVAAVPPIERSSLVERLEMRIFDKGDLLVQSGEESPGLHLIVSGEIAIVAREWGERVLLATLGAGETVGEMELVLCRQPFADAVATRPTATLFLSRDEYSSLIQDHPAILHGLYAIAVQRQAETSFALKSGSAVVADDWLLDAAGNEAQPDARPRVPSVRPEAAPPAEPLRALAMTPPASKAPPDLPMPAVADAREPSRRTLPPPPHRNSAPPPSSLSPTTGSLQPPHPSAAPARPASWLGITGAAAAAAVAASVLTILAARSEHGADAASAGAAKQAPPAAMALPPPQSTAPVEAPAPVAAASLAPVATASPAASPASPPSRASDVTAAVAATPAKTVAASSPAAPPRGAAPRTTATPAPAPKASPAATPAADDEFGGRQ
jgi:CRP-like cAMP-binding protein